eukprot:CAMPEP_0114247850 /NCGR_PEP_ID=MMETSP0058-20121206/13246_1 /TAXON_ID=36894 /ORGANISM="Pyramimonas parkeae, CCMP726" /LENGTH=411 /DNA_ID=CAMNT_0001361191 /DNA_START=152 /DNA_END=1387 /DNA_ORIENTATION=+
MWNTTKNADTHTKRDTSSKEENLPGETPKLHTEHAHNNQHTVLSDFESDIISRYGNVSRTRFSNDKDNLKTSEGAPFLRGPPMTRHVEHLSPEESWHLLHDIQKHRLYSRMDTAYYLLGKDFHLHDNAMRFGENADGDFPLATTQTVQTTSSCRPSTSTSHKYTDPSELDGFMEDCCKLLETWNDELMQLHQEADTSLAEMESRFANISRDIESLDLGVAARDEAVSENHLEAGPAQDSCSRAEGEQASSHAGSSATAAAHLESAVESTSISPLQEEYANDGQLVNLQQFLKRKYSNSLQTLKQDFLKKKKHRTKLSPQSIQVMQEWFKGNIFWPYPSDKDKEQLLSMCGPEIEKRQVDNWFINSRKRQWFKLFTHGDVPTTEDAARQELLNIYKSEEEVVVVMQKAWNFG